MILPSREQFTGRPFALLALAGIFGVIMAEHSLGWPGFSKLFPTLSLCGAVLAWRTGRWRWCVLMMAGTFAMLHHVELRATRLHPVRQELEEKDVALEVAVVGKVMQPLRQDLPGAEPGDAWFEASRIECLRYGKVWEGPTMLRLLPGQEVSLSPGVYQVRGWLRLPPTADNPGQFDARSYQLRLGLVAELRAMKVECLHVDRMNLAAALGTAAEHCRKWVTNALSLGLADHPDEQKIILAMALGTTAADSRELQKPFRESGTLHIFSVSGLHVAALGMIFWAFLRPLGLRRGIVVGVLVPTLFAYAFITGWRPSAVRAAMMSAVILLGVGLHRRSDLLNSLGSAALILIALDTQQVFAPGFQLSFGVIATIALLEKRLMALIKHWIDPDPFLPRPLLSTQQRWTWWGKRKFAGLFTVSTAALAGSLPLILGHFHMVTPISIVANVLLVPLSFLVLGTAILTLLSGAIHFTFLQMLFTKVNLHLAAFTFASAQFFAGIPGGNWYVPGLHLKPRPPAEMTVLRLSEGAAAQHLRVGSYHWMLDTGAEGNFPYEVGPYLQYAGVNELRGLLLSHGDTEHVGAALRLQTEYHGTPAWEPSREGMVGSLRLLHTQGFRASPLDIGDTLDLGPLRHKGNATAKVLYPPSNKQHRRSDDRTLVVRLDLGEQRMLWCNDAGFLAEKALLEAWSPEELQCDVIIRNQHASDFSMLPEFLDAVRPQLVISSNQAFPPEQKLPATLRASCAQRGIPLIDQSETGAITLSLWPEHMEIHSMRGTVPAVIIHRRSR